MIWISGPKISELLAKQGKTASQLAGKTVLHRDTVYDILNASGGRSRRQEKTGREIAGALRVNLADIIANESECTRPSSRMKRKADAIPQALQDYHLSFDNLMASATGNFVGRRFLFKAIDGFLQDPTNDSGYFVLRGDPGIGKSAFMAAFVQRRALPVFHFNVGLQGINSTSQCLGNLCTRLILHFKLPYASLPSDSLNDGAFLDTILQECASRLSSNSHIVIAIDALDEVDVTTHPPSANPLFLPYEPPRGVYFVLSARRKFDFNLRVLHSIEYEIDALSGFNSHDIGSYVQTWTTRAGVRSWLKANKIKSGQFVDGMIKKSEGNFMYLRHVLPSIERGEYSRSGLQVVPRGLRAYYREHWAQMQTRNPERVEHSFKPLLCCLAAVQRSVGLSYLSDFTGLSAAEIMSVLKDWWEFLHVEPGPEYRLYHSEFLSFLSDEIDPGLGEAHIKVLGAGLKHIRRAKKKRR